MIESFLSVDLDCLSVMRHSPSPPRKIAPHCQISIHPSKYFSFFQESYPLDQISQFYFGERGNRYGISLFFYLNFLRTIYPLPQNQ